MLNKKQLTPNETILNKHIQKITWKPWKSYEKSTRNKSKSPLQFIQNLL